MADNESLGVDFTEYLRVSAQKLRSRLSADFDSHSFESERRDLIEKLMRKRLCIVTGGPGTGKSHEVLWFVNQLRSRNERFILLAPTGKAVMRLSHDPDFSGLFAKTIDKFLSEQKDEKFAVGTVVVDEMSMVDLPKLDQLFETIDFRNSGFKRLVLIGDRHQLPPIGFGKPFIDAIDYCEKNSSDALAELSVNCRQETDNTTLEFASLFGVGSKCREEIINEFINDGEKGAALDIRSWQGAADLGACISSVVRNVYEHEFADKKRLAPAAMLDAIIGLPLTESGDVDPNGIDRMQLISPYRTGTSGSIALNLGFQKTYRSARKYVGWGNEDIVKIGDKVIVVENIYHGHSLVLPNGMTGIVDYKGNVIFSDAGSSSKWGELERDKVEPAYVITVHKAQGSGFDYVGTILPRRRFILSKELVYTALTRSKKKLYLLLERTGDVDVDRQFIDEMSKRSSVAERRTALLKRAEPDFSYSPAPGVKVKSRVEYIIWKKLEEFQRSFGAISFEYEAELDVGKGYLIHPDFTVEFAEGKKYYWEHLGKLKDLSYRRGWFRRKRDYEDKGLLGRVITTDELAGISDAGIAKVIDALVKGESGTENEFSLHHFQLGAP